MIETSQRTRRILYLLASLPDLVCNTLEIAHGFLKFAGQVACCVAEVTHDTPDLSTNFRELAGTKDDQGDHQNHPELHWTHTEEIHAEVSIQHATVMLCSVVVGRSIPFGPGSTLRSMVIFDCAQVFYRGAMRLHRSDILLDARLLAYRRGGISRYVEALVHWLPRVAPDLDVRPFINRQTQLDTTPVRVLTPPHHRFERSVLGIELSARFPRLVHSPDFITPRLIGAKRVVTVHDLNFINHPEQLTPDSLRYYRQLKSSLRSVDRIIAVSSYTAGQLETVLHIDPSRIDVIPNGVETLDREPSQTNRAVPASITLGDARTKEIALERPIILMVGTIEPRKRHVLLLQALDVMRHERTLKDVALVIVGQRGWKCDAIVNEIERGIWQ